MHDYEMIMIVQMKQKELEKKANEEARYASIKQESFFNKAVRKFSSLKISNKQNNYTCNCEC